MCQVIERAHGRASYAVHLRGIEVEKICIRFGVERWAEDHWTLRGFGRIVTPLNAVRDCSEFRPPVEGTSLGTELNLRSFDQFSDRQVRRGLRSGRFRLRAVTKVENGPQVELIRRS